MALGGSLGGQIVGLIFTVASGCCLINLLSFGFLLGVFLIPLVHAFAALHTYMRSS